MEAINKNKEERKLYVTITFKVKDKEEFERLKESSQLPDEEWDFNRRTMINKNKEEIEKILNGCGYCGNKNLCPECRIQFQERIKTSILWCKNEIEFLDKVIRNKNWFHIDLEEEIDKMILQLQTHLNWLKEQEK